MAAFIIGTQINHLKFLFVILAVLHSILRGDANSLNFVTEKEDVETLVQAGCNSNGTVISKGVCIEDTYDLRSPPDQTQLPIDYQGIRITFWNYAVLAINEKRETLEIDIDLSFWWRDDRIKTDSALLNTFSWYFPAAAGVTLRWYDDTSWDKTIWHPKGIHLNRTYKEQLVHEPADFLHITSGDSISGINLGKNTTILYYRKNYRLGLNCKFDFSGFPMDSQQCSLQLTNRFIRELKLYLHDFNHDDFASNPLKTLSRDGFDFWISFEENNATRNSSVISDVKLNLNMKRIMYPYLSQYYVPAAWIVCISHLSFIIPPSSIPGRLGLVATLFLTMTNIYIDSNVSK